jgi:hypothetical protein
MTMNVEVLEDSSKGGNPGRMCRIPSLVGENTFYLKYCPGSRIGRGINLSAFNQPFYEAVANSVSRKLGISVPRTSVLLDEDDSIEFLHSKFNGGRDYFASGIVVGKEGDTKSNLDLIGRLLEEDRLYFDLIKIEDILGKNQFSIGRRDNYLFFKYPGGYETGGEIVYVDLGCSLGIRVKEGRMSVKESLADQTRNSKKMRNMRKSVSSWHLITKKQDELINLGEILEGLGSMPISTINPCGEDPAEKHVPKKEMDQLRDLLTVCMYEGIKKNAGSEYLIKE